MGLTLNPIRVNPKVMGLTLNPIYNFKIKSNVRGNKYNIYIYIYRALTLTHYTLRKPFKHIIKHLQYLDLGRTLPHLTSTTLGARSLLELRVLHGIQRLASPPNFPWAKQTAQ